MYEVSLQLPNDGNNKEDDQVSLENWKASYMH